MASVGILNAVVRIRKWPCRLLMPIWYLQVAMGFDPWIPGWAISVRVSTDGD